MSAPLLLVTNDDGIDSYFLTILVKALMQHFEVNVVAPSSEKSWSGTSMSRSSTIRVETYPHLNCKAWAVDGTPADCVNIALGHLLPEKPAKVVSGVNIGVNITIPMILSSGTVAGALQGAAWGIPSLALSIAIPNKIFDEVKENKGQVPVDLDSSLNTAAAISAEFAANRLVEVEEGYIVHNVNFPHPVYPDTPIENTVPARLTFGSLFEKSGDDTFQFSYHPGTIHPPTDNTDWACLRKRHISYSRLDFAMLASQSGNLPDFRTPAKQPSKKL